MVGHASCVPLSIFFRNLKFIPTLIIRLPNSSNINTSKADSIHFTQNLYLIEVLYIHEFYTTLISIIKIQISFSILYNKYHNYYVLKIFGCLVYMLLVINLLEQNLILLVGNIFFLVITWFKGHKGLCYNNLSFTHKSLNLKLSFIIEPTSYSIAITNSNWQRAMRLKENLNSS